MTMNPLVTKLPKLDHLASDVFSKRRFDLIGIGECMVEFYSDSPLQSASILRRSYGGDVLNALVACARLGGQCGFVTKVGDDPFGNGLLEAWIQEGIDTECAPKTPGENGVYFISTAEDGEREFTYRRQGTPASCLGVADISEAYLGQSRWLLLSGITQALSQSARAATLAAAKIAKRMGVRVVYDPNYRPRLWDRQGGLEAAKAAFKEVSCYAEWVLPSHPVDSILLDSILEDSSQQAFSTADGFTAYCPNVALKCGEDGCIVSSETGVQIIPGAVARKIIDTTGAGDLWNGCFLYQLISGHSANNAAIFANQQAAAKLAHRGAIPPLKQEA